MDYLTMLSKYSKRWKFCFALFICLVTTVLFWQLYRICGGFFLCGENSSLILSEGAYGDEGNITGWKLLYHRVKVQPFNLVSLIIFGCAIIHTFLAPKINQLAQRLRYRNQQNNLEVADTFGVEILRFMG